MSMNVTQAERAHIERLRRHAVETRTLLSNAQKPERERMIVRGFLRCIGEVFSDDEIRTGTEEPVDVVFHTAQFQIREILGGRQRGREWRERESRYEQAEHLSDLLEPWTSSEPIAFDELVKTVSEALVEKAARYGAVGCSNLDALIYIDLRDRHLWPLPSEPLSLDHASAAELNRQGWRSVSVLFVPYGVVLVVRPDAPTFLLGQVGHILKQWPHYDGWFDQ